MAIALVSSVNKAGPSGGGTTTAIDTTGATLLVLTTARYLATSATPSDSASNTWTGLTDIGNSAGFQNACRIWYVENPTTSATHTFTFAATALYPAFGASAWSGTATSSVFDKQSVNDNGDVATSTSAPGSVTPAADGALVIACAAYDSASAVTIDGGFTELYDTPLVGGSYFGGMGAYLIQTTAAAANPTVSYAGSNANCTAIAVFAAPAAATGRPNRLTLLGVR